jgi:hypothetical protein
MSKSLAAIQLPTTRTAMRAHEAQLHNERSCQCDQHEYCKDEADQNSG